MLVSFGICLFHVKDSKFTLWRCTSHNIHLVQTNVLKKKMVNSHTCKKYNVHQRMQANYLEVK